MVYKLQIPAGVVLNLAGTLFCCIYNYFQRPLLCLVIACDALVYYSKHL